MKKKMRKQDMPILSHISQDGQLVYVVQYPNGKVSYCWDGKQQAEQKIEEYIRNFSR